MRALVRARPRLSDDLAAALPGTVKDVYVPLPGSPAARRGPDAASR